MKIGDVYQDASGKRYMLVASILVPYNKTITQGGLVIATESSLRPGWKCLSTGQVPPEKPVVLSEDALRRMKKVTLDA